MIRTGKVGVVGIGAFACTALLLVFPACGSDAAPREPAASVQSAIGEPNSGFPSPVERLGIMAINRARSDPATVKGPQSAAYAARPPVLWNYALSRSARFQAISLLSSGVGLQHESPCALKTDVGTSGCTGEASCACATPVPTACNCNSCTPVGTAPFTRIAYFTAGSGVNANGEVAAAGYADPFAVVDGWMNEAANADGHRRNLTDQGISSNVMGYGHSNGTGGCWQTFDFSDSGTLAGTSIPKIPTAAVRPPSGAAGSFTFYATWADPALGAPSSLNVVIDGACKAMTRELGTDTLNATYKVSSTLAAGCHSYYVLGADAGSTNLVYPTTGALTISVGGTACSADYLASAPAASCAANGGGGAGGASGTGGAGAGATTAGGTGVGGKAGAGGTGVGGKAGVGGTSGSGGTSNVAGKSGLGGSSGSSNVAGGAGRSGSGGGGSGSSGASGTSGASGSTGQSGSDGLAGAVVASGGVAGLGGASNVDGGTSTTMGGAIAGGASAASGTGAEPSTTSPPSSQPSGCSCSLEGNSRSGTPLWCLGLLAVLGARAGRRYSFAKRQIRQCV